MAALTIRNVSPTPLTLKLLERYESLSTPSPSLTSVSGITANLTNLMSNATASPTSPQLASNAESFTHQDVDIRIDPLRLNTTEIKTTERGPNETLRLTFEVDGGERYRLDVPPLKGAGSATLTALTPNPAFQFTAVYLSNSAFLTIFSTSHMGSWMRDLRDATPLSALSIPGTHNSPTCHKALPSVRCQAVGIRAQLDNGVRFFDIRVQPEAPEDPGKDGLVLVHGVFPISLTGNKYFRGLIEETEAFLRDNSSETVIISLKREGPGKATDEQLSKIVKDHYAGDNGKWWTEPRIPVLGEARGKIVLVRRFVLDESLKGEWGGQGWAINAESWAYNTPDCECPGGKVRVQDFCEVLETENIDTKIKYSSEHLDRAGGCCCVIADGRQEDQGPAPFYFNFLSASNFWKVGCWPEKIAAKLNPAMVEYLCKSHGVEGKEGDGSTGIVVCDWVGEGGDWDLVRCIVGMNTKLELRG
ncbi:MAG: hypothetical protein M1814_003698 [Vezdaea aestivalis]|nr:MAG: hypothetical protein M1814_003698 [Vezdaea aestivalis]